MSSTYYSRANSYSRSYNAIQAEHEDRYPRARAAKHLGLSLKAFDAGCEHANYSSSEWHHVGKYANKVDYYDCIELAANPLFWKGAITRANAAYCKEQAGTAVRARLQQRMTIEHKPQVAISSHIWEEEYTVTYIGNNDHLLFKGIREIARSRARSRNAQLKYVNRNNGLSNRAQKNLKLIRLYANGTIELNNGKQVSFSQIDWQHYTPGFDYGDYVSFYLAD